MDCRHTRAACIGAHVVEAGKGSGKESRLYSDGVRGPQATPVSEPWSEIGDKEWEEKMSYKPRPAAGL